MAWDPYRQPIDSVVVSGVKSPGIAKVRDAKKKNIITTKRPAGAKGAAVTFEGQDLSTFTVTLEFDTPGDFEQWAEFRRVIDRPPGGTKPQALIIEHPVLADLDVTQVLVEGRTQLTQRDDGGWTVDIYFKAYAKAKPVRAITKGGKKKDKQSPEEDARDRKIRELMAERDALAGA